MARRRTSRSTFAAASDKVVCRNMMHLLVLLGFQVLLLPLSLHALSLERAVLTSSRTSHHLSSRQPSALSALPENTNGCHSPSEFDLGVGRAMDTLRRDYPLLLVEHPDYSIYRRDISVIDPSGVHVNGLSAYKNAFRLLHAVVTVLYCAERSNMDFRMCYDPSHQHIRIHWNAHVVPREIFGSIMRQPLHVDGISVYELDRVGNITQHRIEQLLINNIPVEPKEGLIAALQDRHQGIAVAGVPSIMASTSSSSSSPYMLEFRVWNQQHFNGHRSNSHQPSSLFYALEGTEDSAASPSTSSVSSSKHHHHHHIPQAASASVSSSSPHSSMGGNGDAALSSASFMENMDWDKFEKKNKSRQKFGLKPLTVEEFLELEQQVAILDAQQRQRMAASSSTTTSTDETNKEQSFLEKFFGQVLKDTCESNFDCERPEICCDFGFRKMCCASGTPVGSAVPQYAYVPIPVDVGGEGGNYDPYPRNY